MEIINLKQTTFDEKYFLETYWQQKPVLLKGFYRLFKDPITPEELAGLACEDNIESRIVIEQDLAEGDNSEKQKWLLENGPFTEERFLSLPKNNWSLLVQSVDHWHQEVHRLLSNFKFLPAHILDDIMISFAPEGGSVGPHFDYYDVFLVQGLGERQWQLGQTCDTNSETLKNCDLAILKNFKAQTDITVEAGDVLYLPAKIAHWGIALNDCLTYSVGFRTPSLAQSISALSDNIIDTLDESERLKFPNVGRDTHAKIDNATLNNFEKALQEKFLDKKILLNWYGKFSTTPKNDGAVQALSEPLKQKELKDYFNKEGSRIIKNEGSRFLHTDKCELFIDGHQYELTDSEINQQFIQLLCYQNEFDSPDLQIFINNEKLVTLLVDLVNKGSLYLE